MSKSYTVIRKRAYWVREVMHIDATDENHTDPTRSTDNGFYNPDAEYIWKNSLKA